MTAPVRSVYLDPLVAPVGDVHIALAVNRYAGGMVQVGTVVQVRASEGEERNAVGGVFADAAIAPVGDVDIAVGVESDAPWGIELPLADCGNVLAAGGELLYSVVPGVNDQYIVVAVNGETGGAVQLPLAGACFAPKSRSLHRLR